MPIASPFQPEPAYTHGQPATTAVLLCNLGTPEAPTPSAVRRYLSQFLRDPRVVEIPRAIWLPILYGIILPLRPAKSAARYETIWTPEGSPLKLWTEKQAKLLQGWLGEAGHQRVKVRYAMRYGNPSIASQLDALKAEGATRILVLPAYPQYCGATTASLFDAVFSWARMIRRIPELRFINDYHDNAGYISALARSIQRYWQREGRPDHLVMSFHGVPARTLHLGDPYHCECHKTARLLAAALGLATPAYSVAFQSRFGKAKWLEPYTEPTLQALARAGVKRVDVVCPGFTSDCLETLEEIAQDARAAFFAAGGTAFHYIPCLNDETAWIGAMGALAEQHLAGWPTRQTVPEADLAASRQIALSRGAAQ